MSYESKSAAVGSRQMAVEELAIPFVLTHNATPASVVLANDEPSVLFLKSEGVDKIASIVSSLGDTATYTGAAIVDANGILALFINLGGDVCKKVISAQMVSRITGVSQPLFLGSATGISALGNIMLKLDSAIDHTATDVDASIIVRYTVTK